MLRMKFGLSKPDDIDKLLDITSKIETSLEQSPFVLPKPRANLSDISLRCFEIDIFASISATSASSFAKYREVILATIYRIVKENGGEFAFDNDVMGLYVEGGK